MVTQLFGSRMYIANASGCSSAYGGSLPMTPYCKDERGFGPCWEQSLFEDNAEYGLGMYLGVKAVRERLAQEMEAVKDSVSADLKAAMEDWIANAEVGEGSRERAEKLEALLQAEKSGNDKLEAIYNDKQFFVKRSQWIIGVTAGPTISVTAV